MASLPAFLAVWTAMMALMMAPSARCLGHCRAGSAFLLHTWRDGAAGAAVMGAQHGAYCVACCWGLMLVLLAFGAMSPVWMAAIAAVIFVEKVLPGGPRLGMALGAGAIVVALLRL